MASTHSRTRASVLAQTTPSSRAIGITTLRNKFPILILTGILISLTIGCSIKWSEAIRSGNISENEFQQTVAIEIQNGMILVPVTIRGKQYRFLFDSGAPFSISNQLQNDYAFRIISKSNIIDSDDNRKKVNWAEVDAIKIGGVSFTNHSAFIGDFEANPILKCLRIDGIIGSNLIRQCNWTIDQEQKILSFYNTIDEFTFKESVIIPFKTDLQYSIFIDVNIGQDTVKNILVDYGSNGSISLNNKTFTLLKDRNIIDEIFLEKGTKQSGIIGVPIGLSREMTFSDSVRMDNIQLKNVMIRTGKTVSIGNDLLSRFKVTIDWDNKKLYLNETEKIIDTNGFNGFRLGSSIEKGVYVQSVVEKSIAYTKGIRPNMKVLKIDTLDFGNDNNFCALIKHKTKNKIFLELVDSLGHKKEYHITKTMYRKK